MRDESGRHARAVVGVDSRQIAARRAVVAREGAPDDDLAIGLGNNSKYFRISITGCIVLYYE